MRVPSDGVVAGVSETSPEVRPWAALWALVIGFFMILVDTTIVSVANPAIMRGLGADISGVLWVTSAYLLSYAVPLLVTGRLGDRFGPRRVYLAGLVVFTISSALCGLSPTIGTLIAARAVQGLGAALMTPQTMAVITRIFPPTRRGQAMSLWGATAAIATLVGPVLGGFLVDGLGWEWIFFVNVPVGVVAFVLARRFVPRLETHHHRFDLVGVALSAVGLFLLVFGIQEGQTFNWGTIVGPITVWELIVAGVVVLGLFVLQQARTTNEPLLPLRLFQVRNFTLANSAIAMVGLAVTSSSLPLVFYYQLGPGLLTHEGCAPADPDGGDELRPRSCRGQARRQGAARSARDDRHGPHGWLPAVVLAVVDPGRQPVVAAALPERVDGDSEFVHVVSHLLDGDARPVTPGRRRGLRRLQHCEAGRLGAGQRRHRRDDRCETGGEPPRWGQPDPQLRWRRTAGVPACGLQRVDVPGSARAGSRCGCRSGGLRLLPLARPGPRPLR